MFRHIAVVIAILMLPCSAQADGLWNKIKKGASDAGQAIDNTANDVGKAIGNTAEDVGKAIGNTADDVGDAVGNAATKTGEVIDDAATAVGDSIESTAEMVSDEETPAQTRARLDEVADETLRRLLKENADAAILYAAAYGSAAFDLRQVTVLGASGGYGRGVAVAKETGARTYMQMGIGGVGLALGIGGFERQLVILFENKADYDDFVINGYDAGAEASGMVGEDNDTEAMRFVDGRSVFYLTKKGWRVAATATGTKYWRDADLN